MSDRLRALGYRVFYDVETMRSGAFNTQLLEAIANCDDVLVVLPPTPWTGAATKTIGPGRNWRLR